MRAKRLPITNAKTVHHYVSLPILTNVVFPTLPIILTCEHTIYAWIDSIQEYAWHPGYRALARDIFVCTHNEGLRANDPEKIALTL
ncbi:MAG: hypothetical protein H6849_02700 [Alphaproteobacteria bacterium]|nr:MAG: hypothetical protein H6849_02700 [Alphaproteobacteria bacterium]